MLSGYGVKLCLNLSVIPSTAHNGAVRGHVDTTVSIEHASCDRERRTTVELWNAAAQGQRMPIGDPQLATATRPPPRSRRNRAIRFLDPGLRCAPITHSHSTGDLESQDQRSPACSSCAHRLSSPPSLRTSASSPRNTPAEHTPPHVCRREQTGNKRGASTAVAPRALDLADPASPTLCAPAPAPRVIVVEVVPQQPPGRHGSPSPTRCRRPVCDRDEQQARRSVASTVARARPIVPVLHRPRPTAPIHAGVQTHIAQEGGKRTRCPRRLRAVRPARTRGGRGSRGAKRASAVPRIAKASGVSPTGSSRGSSDPGAEGTGCGADDGEQGRLAGVERKSAGVRLTLRRALALATCIRGSKAAFRGFLMDVHCHCFFDRRFQTSRSAR
ncbi:hypothetical protein B0H15DRAFT_863181 [Mycena belliarum]|uniref:Uncharacterized protein n=1 Tax=Mycena belliarum TaxID=1033014 RepID=A0AAD6TUA9_9AGAR|nr:hypothetical protein B0H15DRAFT_863181 [Mycena belliae]